VGLVVEAQKSRRGGRGGDDGDGERWWIVVGYGYLGIHPPKLGFLRVSHA